jgi:predicted oxidoreductase (fatty acid repression mutant protein)
LFFRYLKAITNFDRQRDGFERKIEGFETPFGSVLFVEDPFRRR